MKIHRGTTSKLARVFVQDSRSSTGAGLAGLVYDSADLTAYWIASGDASATAIALVAATVGTFTSGGFKEIDSTNMPGWYELGIPNGAIDSGEIVHVHLHGAVNMVPAVLELELDAVDYQDGAGFGLSRLDAAVGSRSTYAGEDTAGTEMLLALLRPITGVLETVHSDLSFDIDQDALLDSQILGQTIVLLNGIATGYRAEVVAYNAGTVTLDYGLNGTPSPGDAYAILHTQRNLVGFVASTNTCFTLGSNSITAAALAADAVTEIQAGLSTLNAAGVRSAVGLATANLDTQLGTIPANVNDLLVDEHGDGTWSGGDAEIHVEVTNTPVSPGAVACTLHLVNDTTALPLADADVWLCSDNDGTNTVQSGQTDTQGDVTFLLTVGTIYYVFAQKDGATDISGLEYTAVAD